MSGFDEATEQKLEAKGWIPTPKDMAESLKTVEVSQDSFEATPPMVSDTPIFDEMVNDSYDAVLNPNVGFNPFLLSMSLKNHINETIEYAISQLDSMWFAVDYHHRYFNPRRKPKVIGV